MSELIDLLHSINKRPKVLVIGDLIIDKYLWGDCQRISPEAPVQIVDLDSESSSLGGAGNVVNNLNSLGADVDIISVIGKCQSGELVKSMLDGIGVSSEYLLTEKNRDTSVKTRVISSHQQVIRFDKESKHEISSSSSNKILSLLKTIIFKYDVILISDYGKGVLTVELTKEIIKVAKIKKKRVLVDPKGQDFSKYKGSFLLTPNKKEAGLATKIEIKNKQSLEKALKFLKEKIQITIPLITLSDEGIAILNNDLEIFPAKVKSVFDVTGAGDTVLASLGYFISCGFTTEKSIELANLAAGVVIRKIGSATVTIEEMISYANSLNSYTQKNSIVDRAEIKTIAKNLHASKKKIIFTNGCFDLLHSGHVKYLKKAKEFGDILIVGLNSDKSVKANKGNSRPINKEFDRAYMLSAIRYVDYVVIFNEETPMELIKSIKPSCLVKGGDYRENEVIGREYANELHIVDFEAGYSSTNIINTINERYK